MEIVRPTVQEWCIPVQYTSSPEIIKNCLQEVLKVGMMNPQASTPDNEENMRKSQKEKLSRHTWINTQLICNDLCQEYINKNHHKLILLLPKAS